MWRWALLCDLMTVLAGKPLRRRATGSSPIHRGSGPYSAVTTRNYFAIREEVAMWRPLLWGELCLSK
ncbi:MAG TPA: hypothetical protein VKY19_16420 [Ktedonosporobacter sp.]|nr:hypothetical protein [Ktedonosporobacter sp.]